MILPRISRDGRTIVFRNLFDFYRYHPGTGRTAEQDPAVAQYRSPPAAR